MNASQPVGQDVIKVLANRLHWVREDVVDMTFDEFIALADMSERPDATQ